jgi:tetratricopeptide (TPR) repeat protein
VTKPYEVVSIDELDRIPVMHGLEWRPIGRRFDVRGHGVNAYTAEKVGDWVIEEHTEAALRHQELYVVVRGRARFTLGDEELDAPTGTFVFIEDPDLKRKAISEESGTTVLALGASPDTAYERSAWEWWFEAYARTPEEGVAILEDGLAVHRDHPALLYHLACMEGKLGKIDEARAHLDRAIELDPKWRERAESDEDLTAVLA